MEELPTLESILLEPDYESLSETDDDIGMPLGERLGSSETTSIGSHLSLNSLNKTSKATQKTSSGVILRHVILKGITTQIVSANVSNYSIFYTGYTHYIFFCHEFSKYLHIYLIIKRLMKHSQQV